MNSRLIFKAADKIIGSAGGELTSDQKAGAEAAAELVLKMVLQDVLLPEYNRWRDVDAEIGIGASGALANVIAQLTIGFDEKRA